MTPLEERRILAAEASGGSSSDVIYAAIEKEIRQRNLSGSVLDYGAGFGNFTRRLLRLGCFSKIAASDILPRPADLPDNIDWFRIDLNDGLARTAEFDTVIAAEVIEHLENPRETAREFHRLLKTGGTLIVTTPNQESFRSLMSLAFRGHHVAFLEGSYPAHITALVRKDLERMLTEAGFSGEIVAGCLVRLVEGIEIQRQHRRGGSQMTYAGHEPV